MTPTTYRPFFRLPPRGLLAMLVVGAVTLAAAVRVAGGTHPQPVLLDALLWLGAIAAAFAWYAFLRRISDRVARRWRAALDARESRLAAARRNLLIAASGNRFIVAAEAHCHFGVPGCDSQLDGGRRFHQDAGRRHVPSFLIDTKRCATLGEPHCLHEAGRAGTLKTGPVGSSCQCSSLGRTVALERA